MRRREVRGCCSFFHQQQKKLRDAKKEQEKELSDLFKAVITAPKVVFFNVPNSQLAFGEDPKSVICPFFKAGRCDKVEICKFT